MPRFFTLSLKTRFSGRFLFVATFFTKIKQSINILAFLNLAIAKNILTDLDAWPDLNPGIPIKYVATPELNPFLLFENYT